MKITSFKDIPKFPQSSYRCSVGLKYLPTMLQGYMYDYRLEMNIENKLPNIPRYSNADMLIEVI